MEQNEVLNQFIQILLPILATFLTGLFTYIGNRLKKVYEEKVNNETAKAVVEDAVKFVEQVYTDLNGKEKLQKATEQVAEVLASKGIKISAAEINMLIESAVYGLNEGWFDKKENQELMQDLKLLATNLKAQPEVVVEEMPIVEEAHSEEDKTAE
jgi:LL-H family phage holin